MKRIITLFFALATLSLSFAQTNANIKVKRSAKEAPIKLGQTDVDIQPRAVECIWESDFTNASDWVLDHDANDCSLDWEIGQNLECTGFYPINPIESSDGYYAMVDSDAYGGEEGGTETEDSWMTMANAVDCSEYENVIVEFDTWYRSWTYEKCWLVVSTDGTFPTDLTPDSEADPANGIYEIFPGISGDGGAELGSNPTTQRINITEAAGGQSQVWIRFNWTGTWGYAWFIDRVCVAEQPADDITLSYGVVSHNGTGEEYGRVPTSQIENGVTCGAGVYNFGVNEQTNVNVTMDVVNSMDYPIITETFGENDMYGYDADGFLTEQTITGPVASDQNVYFEKMVEMSTTVPADIYTATFTASSDGDSDTGENFGDNSTVREFSITEDIYSTDGIDVYSNPSITRMGTGSFTDATDGFMMMSYYDVSSEMSLGGVRIYLDSYAFSSPLTVAGGEMVVAIRDTAAVNAETFDPGNTIASSDFYLVTAQDVDVNGFITIPFDPVVTLSPDAYYISVEMYSNGNSTDIYILDDETVPQPAYLSRIYIPGDQVYTNGTAAAIRMLASDSPVYSIAEESIEFNIYPNPSNGMINVDLKESGEFLIEVCDMLGKVVYQENTQSSTIINLEDLDKGVYFVSVSNNNTTTNTKLIIE
ncbi:MAG: hypothetical protein CMP49_04530 [Flavobacteriales bacterium]|jgi:hypothetical protein|nr:hypothetical protein [Flavobacteriales bacterium]|tara:strand:- start:3545 stop:5488 length:1944 start_codon:yes stop_codon:yes gene_type:complete